MTAINIKPIVEEFDNVRIEINSEARDIDHIFYERSITLVFHSKVVFQEPIIARLRVVAKVRDARRLPKIISNECLDYLQKSIIKKLMSQVPKNYKKHSSWKGFVKRSLNEIKIEVSRIRAPVRLVSFLSKAFSSVVDKLKK